MNTAKAIEVLNEKVSGWTASENGLICNPSDGGGIIDTAIATGDWFVISDTGSFEGIKTLAQAVECFLTTA